MGIKACTLETTVNKEDCCRPQRSWLDDVKRIAGGRWYHTAKDRTAWKQMKEAFVQEWLIKKKKSTKVTLFIYVYIYLFSITFTFIVCYKAKSDRVHQLSYLISYKKVKIK